MGLSVALVAGLIGISLVAPIATAEAASINVTAPQAQMSGHVGTTASGSTSDARDGDRYRFGSASTATTSGSIDNPGGSNGSSGNPYYYSNGATGWVSNGSTAWTAHGQSDGNPGSSSSLFLSHQSSLGFQPSSVTSISTGSYFNLGRMVHKNTPVSVVNDWFKGNLNIRFMGRDMSYGWLMNETLNDCNSSTNCANDLTTFTNQVSDQTFTVDGITYTLVVAGFTSPNAANNTCLANPTTITPINQFSTKEETSTYGCLYASVEQVRKVTVKKVVESPYAAAPARSFGFTSTSTLAGSPWSAPGTATLSGGSSFTRSYNSGETIVITEGAQSAPWAFTSLSCVDGAGAPVGTVSGQSVTIQKGTTAANAKAADITCTYTNTYTPRATLTLKKNVVSTGQPAPVAVPADWTLTAQGEGSVAAQSISGAGNSVQVTSQSVIAGTYALSEAKGDQTRTAGYVQDGSWTCTNNVTVNGGKITLANGQSTTCTVTNRYQTGSLAITKTVVSDPAGGYTSGTAKAFTAKYSCTVGASTPMTGQVTVRPNTTNGQAGATATIPNLPAGASCTVTEVDPPEGSTGLVNTSWQWGTPVINPSQAVTIPVGGTATANITNQVKQNTGTLVIGKQVLPRGGVPAGAYTGGTTRTFPITYTCSIGTTPTASGTVNVVAGQTQSVGGIPATSRCELSEPTQSVAPGDFADASFRWDGSTASSPAVIPVNGTASASVTNYFTRDMVDLRIEKKVTGAGYTAGTFKIDWSCGTGDAVTGTVTLSADGAQTVKVPAGVACSVVEQPGRPDLAPGYVWGDAGYAGFDAGTSTVTVPRGQTRTVAVTNPNTIGFNRISLTKQIAQFADQVTSGTSFTVKVSCDAPAQGETADYAHSFTFSAPLSGAQQTPYLPIGTSCDVVETALPNGSENLPDGSYQWDDTPAYDGLTNGAVTVPQSTAPAEVTVINDVSRVHGALSITKRVTVPEGIEVSDSFTGAWSCRFGGDQVANGTWQAPPAGGSATLTNLSGDYRQLLVGSLCTVGEDHPDNPVVGDNSYSWAVTTPTDLTPVTVEGVEATVNNVLNRTTGTFAVTKSVSGGQAPAQFADTDFTFDYVCDPASGADITGELSMKATQGASPSEVIPAGSVCTVTERLDARPAPVDPFRWDGVSYAVTGATGAPVGENGVRFTIPADGARVAVTATNQISAKTGSLTVKKAVEQLDGGFIGGDRELFPMTLTCIDPTTGASSVVPGSPKTIDAGGSATWDGIPLGAECSVQEGQVGDAEGNGLKDASFTWGQPAYSDSEVEVKDADTPTITVTNSLERVFGSISMNKVFLDNGFTGVVSTDRSYNGTWSCSYEGSVAASGTWSGTGSSAGQPATLQTTTGDIDRIPLTSTCSVTEDTLSAPSASDSSYRWQAPQFKPIESVSATPSDNLMVVTNSLARDLARVTVQKKLSGETVGYAGGDGFAGFPVAYVCALNPADLSNPDAIERIGGEINVQPGHSAVALAENVPQGWTCAVNEGQFVTATDTWLVDNSYAWGAPAITVNGQPYTDPFKVGTEPVAVTLDNPIKRQKGTLSITKQIASGLEGAVKQDATFSGGYSCVYAEGTGHEEKFAGSWRVDHSGAATLTGDTELPYGTTCAVTETDPRGEDLVDASWTWGEESVTASPATVSGDGAAAFLVTNTPERVYSSLKISKALTGPSGGFGDADQTVTGSWSCTYPGEAPISGTWSAPAKGGAATLSPADARIPVTSACTVREDTLDPTVFRDASYGWGPAPDPQTVVVPAEAAEVTITNVVERLMGTFTITKKIDRGAGVTLQVPSTDPVYSGTYECTYAGGSTGPLPWSITGENNSFVAPESQYADSVCRVIEEHEPSRVPVVGDSSFQWGGNAFGDPVTVGVNATVNVDVTNQILRNSGSFTVTKVFEGDAAGLPEDPTYTFGWSCVADNGDTLPTDAADATFTIAAGERWEPNETIPTGSVCRVTETAMPDPVHDTFTWSTDLAVAEATMQSTGVNAAGEPTISFETPDAGEAAVLVTATNTLTRAHGSFSVTKTVPEGSVTTAGMKFTGEYTCTGPLPSDTPVKGTWGPIEAGATWTSEATIPVDSTCVLDSEARDVWPFPEDRSHQWDGDADLGGQVVAHAQPQTITVTNRTHRVLGGVTWQKVAVGSLDLLAGSTWTLTGPGVPEGTVVTDCTAEGCPAGSYLDSDPAPGRFHLTDLAWGDYTLTEKSAPAGYYRDTNAKPFTIGSEQPGPLETIDLGQISNTPIDGPEIPLTGGLGRDFFLLLGLLVAGLGLGAAAMLRNRARRQGVA